MNFFKETGHAIHYRARLTRRAFADSLAFYGWGLKTIFLIAGPLGVGVLVRLVADPGAIRPFVISGVYGVVGMVTLFLLVLLWHMFVASSRVDREQADELTALKTQLAARNKSSEVAELLLARYDAGLAILTTSESTFMKASMGQDWHQDNLRLLEPVLSRKEYVGYKTAVLVRGEMDYISDGVLNPYLPSDQAIEAFTGRLNKLRAMLMRFYPNTEFSGQPDS